MNPMLQDLLIDRSVLSRANIAAVLAERPRSRPHDMRTAFEAAAAAAQSTDPPLSRFYRLLALAFQPSLRPEQTLDPFVPLATFTNGDRTLVLRDLNPGHLDILQAALDENLHPAFNAR